MEIIHNIALDVSRQGIQASIPITRGENGVRKLVITLRNKGAPIELVEGDSAVLYLDTDAFEPVIVYTNKGVYPNSLVYDVTANASATIGQKKATIQISRAYGRITYSPEILLLVTENGTYNSQVLNSPPYAAVLKAQAQAEEYCRQAEEKIESVDPKLEKITASFNEQLEKCAKTKEVDTQLSGKVNLPPIGGYTRIPVVKPESAGGGQGYHSLTASNVRGTVMLRDSETGRSKINTPDEYDDIANKEYVDSREVAVREDMSAMDNRLSNDFASRIEMAEQTLNGNIEDTKRELSANIDEVESIAKGATQAESFFDYEEMVEKLNVAPRDTYRIGQSLFINTRNVPDLWIYNKGISSTTYNYSTDEVFVNELKSKGYVKVGYFTLSALETQKVDLTDYPTTEEVASIVKSVTYDKKEIDNKVESIKPDNIYANVLKGTESGAVVSMDDVSPFAHKVIVKTEAIDVPIDTQITVTSRSKNFFDISKVDSSLAGNDIEIVGNSIIFKGYGLHFCRLKNVAPELIVGKTYTLNAETTGSTVQGETNLKFIYVATPTKNFQWSFGAPLTMTEDILAPNTTLLLYGSMSPEGERLSTTIRNIQIEEGTVATGYEPYAVHESVITTIAEGAELNSVAPNMTIATDTQGVIIDAEYNKDTNKVIEKLTQAIISLGGNI
jgi:hypothetical protein